MGYERVGDTITQIGLGMIERDWAKQLKTLEAAEEEERFQRDIRRRAKYDAPQTRSREVIEDGKKYAVQDEGRIDVDKGFQWTESGRQEVIATPVGRPIKSTDGDEYVMDQQYSDGTVRPLMVDGKERRGNRYKPNDGNVPAPRARQWTTVQHPDDPKLRARMDADGNYLKTPDGKVAIIPAAEARGKGKNEPGSSQDNPLVSDGSGPKPPSGTWVKLRNGSVVQVP